MKRYIHSTDSRNTPGVSSTARREHVHGPIQPMDDDDDDYSILVMTVIAMSFLAGMAFMVIVA